MKECPGKPPPGLAALLLFMVAMTLVPVTQPAGRDDEKFRHDLKNQLAVISGFVEILLHEARPADPRRPDLEEISKAAGVALDLVDRWLPAQAGRLSQLVLPPD